MVESELVESRGHGMIAKKVSKGVKASETKTSQNEDVATEEIVRIKDVGAVEHVCRSENKTSKQDTEIEIEVVPAPTMAEQMVGSKFLVPVMVMLQSLID